MERPNLESLRVSALMERLSLRIDHFFRETFYWSAKDSVTDLSGLVNAAYSKVQIMANTDGFHFYGQEEFTQACRNFLQRDPTHKFQFALIAEQNKQISKAQNPAEFFMDGSFNLRKLCEEFPEQIDLFSVPKQADGRTVMIVDQRHIFFEEPEDKKTRLIVLKKHSPKIGSNWSNYFDELTGLIPVSPPPEKRNSSLFNFLHRLKW